MQNSIEGSGMGLPCSYLASFSGIGGDTRANAETETGSNSPSEVSPRDIGDTVAVGPFEPVPADKALPAASIGIKRSQDRSTFSCSRASLLIPVTAATPFRKSIPAIWPEVWAARSIDGSLRRLL